MNAAMRERRKELMQTLIASTRDLTRAQRDAARSELRALEVQRMEALRRLRARIQTDLAAAQTAVLQQPPEMTSVPTYLVAAIAALASYIDEHHAVLEQDSSYYLESLEALRPTEEELPSLRALDPHEAWPLYREGGRCDGLG